MRDQALSTQVSLHLVIDGNHIEKFVEPVAIVRVQCCINPAEDAELHSSPRLPSTEMVQGTNIKTHTLCPLSTCIMSSSPHSNDSQA